MARYGLNSVRECPLLRQFRQRNFGCVQRPDIEVLLYLPPCFTADDSLAELRVEEVLQVDRQRIARVWRSNDQIDCVSAVEVSRDHRSCPRLPCPRDNKIARAKLRFRQRALIRSLCKVDKVA